MPNANRSLGVYVVTANPDTVNTTTLYRGGELGVAYDYNDRAYQVVQCDSGTTLGRVGAVTAGQLAFWKDKDRYLVTNDGTQAVGGPLGFPNECAGIFRCAVTAGNYCHILQRGDYILVADDNATTIGMRMRADATANTARAVGIALGGVPTYNQIGVARGASAANFVYMDVDIPNIP